MSMTADQIKAQLKAQYAPWVDLYFPVFTTMSAQEFQSWLLVIAAGDIKGAYSDLLKKMGNTAVLADREALISEWQVDNVRNKANLDLIGKAAAEAVDIALTIGLAVVGL